MPRVDPESEAARRIGEVLRGKWKLEKVIGVGGMAAVYAATHRNGMKGAVKLLHQEFASDTESRERFLREGYVANRVERGAVKVLDDDTTEDGSVYLVMELLTGETTDEIAQRRPNEQLALPEVVWVGQALLDVLIQAHDVGIVHRDIKPENLFVCTNGELRVLDFGIARLRDGKPGGLKKTNTTNAMGTPAFMPAEQALADWDRVGPRSDIYSAGATLFTLLTGELTHQARTAQELMIMVATKPARALRAVMPTIPPQLAAVIDKACAFRPDDRFADARSMRAAIDAAAVGVRPVPPAKNAPAAAPLSASAGQQQLVAPALSASAGQQQLLPQQSAYGAPPPGAQVPLGYAQTALSGPQHMAHAGYAQRPAAPAFSPPGPAGSYAQQGYPQASAYGAYPQQPAQGAQAPHQGHQGAWSDGSGVTGPHVRPMHPAGEITGPIRPMPASPAGEITGPVRPMHPGEITGPTSAPVPSHPQAPMAAPPASAPGVKMTMKVDPRAAQEAYMPAQWNTAAGGMSPAAHLAKKPPAGGSARIVLAVVGVLLAIVLVVLIVVLATR